MREYQPFVLSALEAPRCPACHASRMFPNNVLSSAKSVVTFVSRLRQKIPWTLDFAAGSIAT
jgi:hypothetical protein